MKKYQKYALMAAGILILLMLNIWRDLKSISSNMQWVTITRGPLMRSVSSTGVVEAFLVEKVMTEVRETVLDVFVKEGAHVKKGELLIKLSNENTLLEYQLKKNSYNEALSSFKNAEKEVNIQKKLLKNFAVSQADVDQAVSALEKAAAALDINKRELEISKTKLDSTDVRSPIDGTVLEIQSFQGRKVFGDKEIITVGDTSKFIAKAQIDELDIRQVKMGQKVQVAVDAYPDRIIDGIVDSIGIQASREAFAKIEVIVSLNPEEIKLLKHNLSCRIYIMTDELPDAIGIPQRAILQKEGDYAWVYTKNKLKMVRKQKIKLGLPAGESVEVLSGLKSGAVVGIPIEPN